MNTEPKICFITAIYGNYEASCKPFVKQTIPADFICFTNIPNIKKNGWIIDPTPYHFSNRSPLDTGKEINSLKNNTHTFNVAKYYKCAFQNIPRLKKYDAVVWLDGTISIINPNVAEYVLKNIKEKKIIGWKHPQHTKLIEEVIGSDFYRYTSTHWFGQNQPFQNVFKQYVHYINNGFSDSQIWITCFVAFDNTSQNVRDFLNLWYLHILTFTTQDQISFPEIVHISNLIPHTLPDGEIGAKDTNTNTDFYIKHIHGK
jgi:hypothetical protein